MLPNRLMQSFWALLAGLYVLTLHNLDRLCLFLTMPRNMVQALSAPSRAFLSYAKR